MLCGGLILLVAVLVVRLLLNPIHVSDPQPSVSPRAHELADRIDPNTASWQDWAALPTIGEQRARQIVAHREAHLAAHPDSRAFQRPEDLLRVPGIGPAMLETLSPYLIFDAPSTRPAQ